MLTAERVRQILVYDPETGVFVWRLKTAAKTVVGKRAGTHPPMGYSVIRVAKRNYYAHVLAWVYMTGKWPHKQIDHINRVRGDNRWSNLREATNKQNHENSSPPSTSISGVKGVSRCKQTGRWLSRITHNGTMRNLGRFSDFGDAVAARRAAEDRLFTHHVR